MSFSPSVRCAVTRNQNRVKPELQIWWWITLFFRSENETLPRYSSGNFTDAEVGSPIMEVLLTPGDVLYIPRGFIHQASTEDAHSLHITVSAYQRNAWIDLLEKVTTLNLYFRVIIFFKIEWNFWALDFQNFFFWGEGGITKNERNGFYMIFLMHIQIPSILDWLHTYHQHRPPFWPRVCAKLGSCVVRRGLADC